MYFRLSGATGYGADSIHLGDPTPSERVCTGDQRHHDPALRGVSLHARR